MSTYICSDLTTACIAVSIVEVAGHKLTPTAVQAVGNMLRDENGRSYNHCYNHRYADDVEPFKTPSASTIAKLSAVPEDKKLGAIRCYIYQSCETPDWESTTAFKAATIAMKYFQVKTGTERGAGWGISLEDLPDEGANCYS